MDLAQVIISAAANLVTVTLVFTVLLYALEKSDKTNYEQEIGE